LPCVLLTCIRLPTSYSYCSTTPSFLALTLILLVICCTSSLLHPLCICINKHKKARTLLNSPQIQAQIKLTQNTPHCPTSSSSDPLSELVIILLSSALLCPALHCCPPVGYRTELGRRCVLLTLTLNRISSVTRNKRSTRSATPSHCEKVAVPILQSTIAKIEKYQAHAVIRLSTCHLSASAGLCIVSLKSIQLCSPSNSCPAVLTAALRNTQAPSHRRTSKHILPHIRVGS
jgi:hypothetical protein